MQTVIDEHKEGGGLDLLTLANQSLNASASDATKPKKQQTKSHKKGAAQSEDISTIVSMVLTLIVSAWSIPPHLKPSDEEVDGFSMPVTRLILRHVPIASQLSQDALDIIGLLGVISAYYVRTGDGWKSYRTMQQATKVQKEEGQQIESVPARPLDDPLDMLLRRGPLDFPVSEGLPT